MSVQLYAGNLSYGMNDESLKQVFEQFGEVTSVKIVKDSESGRSRGFGFVEMTAEGAAESAIQSLDNTDLQGRNIRVNIARPKKSNGGM
jgi:RNA recognition motif-containing protein